MPAEAEMVLVYDLRRDRQYRDQILLGLDDQWQAYLRGLRPIALVQGRITRLLNAARNEPMFQIDDGARRSLWPKQGDPSWYAVGLRAKVETAMFHGPELIGEMQVVTRIWIGK